MCCSSNAYLFIGDYEELEDAMEEWVMLCNLFSESLVSEPALWIRTSWAAIEQLDQEEEHDPTLKARREEYRRISSHWT